MMNQDPFSSFRMGANKLDELASPNPEHSPNQHQAQEGDAFSNYRVEDNPEMGEEEKPEVKENSQILRHVTRSASRALETIVGGIGDVSGLIESLVHYGAEQFLSPERAEKVKEHATTRKTPTSSQLQELSEEASEGYTSPQGKTEEVSDEVIKTFSSLLGPMKFRKALGVAAGSVAAKEGAGILGFGEGVKESTKLGTMFLMSLINPQGALKYSASKYKTAEELSKGASIKAGSLEKTILDTSTKLEEGITTAAKSSVLKSNEDLLNKINNGKIKVHDLMAAKRDINSIIGEPSSLQGVKRLLNKLGKDIDNAIKPYEKINPEFAKAYRPANEIFSAIKQGNKAANFVKNTLGSKSILGALGAEIALGAPEAIIPTLGIGATAYSGAKVMDFGVRLAKSRELQKYYQRAMLAATREDAGALRLYEKKIKDALNLHDHEHLALPNNKEAKLMERPE